MALADKLTAIADVLRSKTGGTAQLTLEQIATGISGLDTSGSGGLTLPDVIAAGDTPIMANTTGKTVTNTSPAADTGVSLTMPKAGTYRFWVCANASGSSGTVHLYKNGTDDLGYKSAGISPTAPISFDVECAAGDVISVWAFRGSGYVVGLSIFALIACIDWNNGF